ncbi:MAG: Gp49 family protein [Bacillota bacterium]|nr:Gp49 family protein [Bacillota bacterium]
MKNTVTQEQIDNLLESADIDVRTIFNKCTIVTVKLANGFVLTESLACVDVANYDEKLGKEICLERIKNKLWELEGYRLQCELGKL